MKKEKLFKTSGQFLTNAYYLMKEKNSEYGSEADTLYNFKASGEFLNSTPERALLGMLSKQLVSIVKMVDEVPKYELRDSQKRWEEKLTDSVVYLVLLRALLMERYGWGKEIKEEGGKENEKKNVGFAGGERPYDPGSRTPSKKHPEHRGRSFGRAEWGGF